jgi:pimeloyl-ACP methyl ester carboxylesterase|tara:strand:+ start:14591 stop:15721 length:1131 start_codon:yes stop_codon:yes gene_type:complete
METKFWSADMECAVRSQIITGINGLDMHVLESGYENPENPTILLLHGFPEIAYSWRKLFRPLTEAGFHVVAPDMRGYGQTTGWSDRYEDPLESFSMLNLVSDCVELIDSLGKDYVSAVVGHDFGSPVAGWSANIRPDKFRSLVLMSAPFAGMPRSREKSRNFFTDYDIHSAMAKLERPRKHYQQYYTTEQANKDMLEAPQGLHMFLRSYYHHKSADWMQNNPVPLKEWSAEEAAKMPTYYIMDFDDTMADTVAQEVPSQNQIDSCVWLTDEELDIYAIEYGRTGFQGGLNWYRSGSYSPNQKIMRSFAGMKIDVPTIFIAGENDWGAFQRPGSLDLMQSQACSDFRGTKFIQNAGHWVQQEQPAEVANLILEHLKR